MGTDKHREADLQQAIPQIYSLLRQGRKFEATNLHREATGCALKVARVAIDKMELEALTAELGADETIEQWAELLLREIDTRIKYLRGLRLRIEFAATPRQAKAKP